MEIGNFCRDPPGVNPQCEREERAHFGLWCIMSSPLVLVGCCVHLLLLLHSRTTAV